MPTDRERHDLFVSLRASLGEGPADTMMDLLPPAGWADVARRADIDRLDAKIDGVEARLDVKIDGVEARLDAKLDGLGARMGGLAERLDARIDRLDAKLDRQFARMVYANLASMLGVAGIVLAATRIG